MRYRVTIEIETPSGISRRTFNEAVKAMATKGLPINGSLVYISTEETIEAPPPPNRNVLYPTNPTES